MADFLKGKTWDFNLLQSPNCSQQLGKSSYKDLFSSHKGQCLMIQVKPCWAHSFLLKRTIFVSHFNPIKALELGFYISFCYSTGHFTVIVKKVLPVYTWYIHIDNQTLSLSADFYVNLFWNIFVLYSLPQTICSEFCFVKGINLTLFMLSWCGEGDDKLSTITTRHTCYINAKLCMQFSLSNLISCK